MMTDDVLAAFETWATARFGADDGARREDASMFLDWYHGTGREDLRHLRRADIDQFFLHHLPRMFIADADDVAEIALSIRHLIEFSADRGSDDDGDRAASVIAHLDHLERSGSIRASMEDSSRFGPSKALMTLPLTAADGTVLPDPAALLSEDPDLSMEDLQGLMNQRMAAFNALPMDERKQHTDAAFGLPTVDLDFTWLPPTEADVEQSAAASDVLRMVDLFARRAEHESIKLTQTGNISLKEAKTLINELETGDSEFEVETSIEYRWLTLVDDVATAAGAVERLKTRIRSRTGWHDQSATERATAITRPVLEGGFLSSVAFSSPLLQELQHLLDAGIPHWFAPALVDGVALDFDEIMALAIIVVESGDLYVNQPMTAPRLPKLIAEHLTDLFDGLERFGVLVWHERPSDPSQAALHGADAGFMVLTPFGRVLLVDLVERSGYRFERAAGFESATAQQMLDIAWGNGISGASILEQWRVDESLTDRLQQVADCVLTGGPAVRLTAFDVFASVGDPTLAEPAIRQLLDSPASGYAAVFLLEHGLADAEDLGSFVDLTPIVDMLSVTITDPEQFNELFQRTAQNVEGDFLTDLQRHDQPEVLSVLEAAGRLVTDKALAKAARKTVIKHRSWLANRRD